MQGYDERIPRRVGIYGPYTERGKEYWKVVVEYHSTTGKREQGSSRHPTREAAEVVEAGVMALIAQGRVGAAAREHDDCEEMTIGQLVASYMEMRGDLLRRSGQLTVNKSRNLQCTGVNLRANLPLNERVSEMTPRRAARLVQAICARRNAWDPKKPLADSSKVIYVSRIRMIFTWAVKERIIAKNPLDGIKPPKIEVVKGKAQLRIDQARRFMEVAMEVVRQPSSRAVALGIPVHVTALLGLCSLTMGPRIGELLDAKVQDLDNGGTLIWVDAGKTDSARRYLEVPEELQPVLQLLAKGRPPEAPLFPSFCKSKYGPRGAAAPHKRSVNTMLKKILKRAGLPVVCPHGLRGTFMSITAPRVGASQAFFDYVGHNDKGKTAHQHYFTAEAKRDLKQRDLSEHQAKASAVLGARPEVFDLASILASMPAEQLLQALPQDTRERLAEKLSSRDKSVSTKFPVVPKGGDSDGKKA